MHTFTGDKPPIGYTLASMAAEATTAVSEIRAAIGRDLTAPYALCPIDGCLLAYALEECPLCRYWILREPCGACGAPVHPDQVCVQCALERSTGRRSLVRPVFPHSEVA